MEDKKYYLFLDDVRYPEKNCEYMNNKIYTDLDWVIVRNYNQFVDYVTENGLPEIVTFDHDLAEPHYHESMYKDGKVYMQYLETISEKTGYECVKWMADYCIDKNLKFPKWYLHTMNPVGKQNMEGYILNFLKHFEPERVIIHENGTISEKTV